MSEGEGSRGGKVIRRTKSGNAVYAKRTAPRVKRPLSVREVQTKAEGVGTVAFAGAIATGLLSKPVDIERAKQKYSKFYSEAGKPSIHKVYALGASADLNGNRVKLGTNRDESALLHELGHLKAARIEGSANNLLKTHAKQAAQEIRSGDFLKGFSRTAAVHVTRPFTNLAIEAEASGFAIKAAKQAGGYKTAAKVAAKLILPYTTYAAGAVVAGATAIQVGKWGKNKLMGSRRKNGKG